MDHFSFRELLRSLEDGSVEVQVAGDRVIGGWESILNTTAERVVGKKVGIGEVVARRAQRRNRGT